FPELVENAPAIGHDVLLDGEVLAHRRPRPEVLRAAAAARTQEGRRGAATRSPGRAGDLRLAVAGRSHADGRAPDRPAQAPRGVGPGAPVPAGAPGRGDRPRAPRPDLRRDPRTRQRRAD